MMKKPTYKICLLLVTMLLSLVAIGQNLVPFQPRYDQAIKGDMLLIGNSNVGLHVTDPYNGSGTNDQIDAAVYVDIDGDPTTFNSSSADLDVPSDTNCYQIVYAGLYWSAVVNGNEPISDIKFQMPGQPYMDITGTEVYYQNAADNSNSNTYVYYHDVTDLLTALPNPEGTYGVANISTLVGPRPNAEGLSAGWSLFVIYEDPLLSSKYITSFDGFTKITPAINETFPISGFQTIPVGPVRAKYAFSTIEGDQNYTGDYLRLNGFTIDAVNNAGNVIRDGNNFFNSSVSIIDPATNTPELFFDRNPNGTNTLGFDAGIVNIPNAGNAIIGNGDTNATISLGSNLDIYYFYFSAFAIEIIAPDIVLTKLVLDTAGNDIGGQLVSLGDQLTYVIGFQNMGNDDATGLIISDILPENIIFNYPADIDYMPPGVTVQSYNPTTRELIFDVDRSIVEEFDPQQEIRINVQVVQSCSLLNDACSNIIENQAFATYRGTINPDFIITNSPSFSSNTGCLLTPTATNFLADIDCAFEEEVILCSDSVVLTAGDGYDSYSWSTSPTGSPVIGTEQSLTVTQTGTYYVRNTAAAPCQSIDQIFNVITFGVGVTNPVIPYADQVDICPNDGKELPNIFLCGGDQSRFIQTSITDATSIIWERLDESSCPAVTITECANEDKTCTWNEVATGPDYLVDTAGQYRLTLNYPGGCFNLFYFNVYENLLEPTVTSQDIICTTPGEIVVENVPNGYEFSIDGVNYQTSNTFTVNVAGNYTVYIRQVGVATNPCIFTVPNVQILDADFSGSATVVQPLCNGELGSVVLSANGARPQYFFTISQGATVVNTVGPTTDNTYTFENLNPGNYTVNITTDDGCDYTEDIEIIEPPLLTATAAITKPLTCTNGEITVYPQGGTAPYYYFVNGSTVFQSVPIIDVATAGTYDILVVDSNNCSTLVSIAIDAIDPPEYTVVPSDILCADAPDSGVITFNVTNTNGNTLRYSIDNGVTFFNSNIFTGLTQGTYDVVVEYTYGPDVCITAPQSVTIGAVAPIDGTATVTAPYTCISTGEITVSGVTGGTAPYMYSIDGVNFQSGQTFTGLTDGTYTVTIRDASNCTFITAPVTIDPLDPVTDLDFSHTMLSCPSNTTTITLTATGGVAPLEYQIIAPAAAATAYQSANTFAGLSPGTYTFNVRDANDCVYTESYTVPPLPPLTLDVVLTKDLDCTATPDADITATIGGGTAPYSYAVSYNGGAFGANVPVAGTTFTYSTPNDGTYEFLITDSLGCTIQSAVMTLNAISLPEIASVVQTQDILCNGDSTAAINITINTLVGTAPFTINVYNDTTATDYGSQTSGLPAGTYTITLTDAKSCTDVETIVITEPDAIVVAYHSVDITCTAGGVSQGSVIIDSVTGGTAPYNYYVTGTNGYSASELNATGTTSTTFDVVDFGLYQINVVDSNGCSVLVQDVLVASPPTDLDININTIVDCVTGGEAVVSIGTTLVSAGPFYFDIYRGFIPPPPPGGTWVAEDAPGSQSATFTGLTPGITYTFIVYDSSTGCSYFETATSSIPTNSTLTTSALTSSNITCVGSADGNVTFNINSIYAGTVDVTYEIFNSLSLVTTGITGTGTVPAAGTLTVTNLGPLVTGNYFVSVTETSGPNAGCGVVTIPFNITESALDLNLTATIDRNANCNPSSGLISAVAQDGTAPYVYQITTTAAAPAVGDPSWGTANTFNVDANTYYVHVKDAYDCIRTTPAIILPADPEPVITAAVTNQCTAVEGDFEIDVALTTPGMAPYSYSINGGAFQQRTAPFTLTNLSSGVHTIEIQDLNGCGNLVSVTIEAPLTIIPDVTALASCNDDDGEITVVGSGGSGTYTYSISPSPGSVVLTGNVFSGVPSGTYTVTITDTVTTCTIDAQIVVPEATPLTLSTLATPVTCFGDNDGTIEVSIAGYSGVYDYEVFDSANNSVTGLLTGNTTTNPQIITGLVAGTYTVVVTETAFPFCSETTNAITVLSPAAPLDLTTSLTADVTCDDDGGIITATATGGWGNYEYELTGAATVAFSSNGVFTNLSAGSYTVNVRDSEGCLASSSITLQIPPPIDALVTPSTTLLSCFGATDATITVSNVTGGQGANYQYTLLRTAPITSTSGPQSSNVFSNLGAGTYTVEVSDSYNCLYTSATIVIDEPTEVQADLVKSVNQTCFIDASLTLSATGGTGTYEYSTDSSFATIIGSFTTSTTFTVTPGDYAYYVRDANGCITAISNSIAVEPLVPLTIDLDTSNTSINCAGESTGAIRATAQGGLGNYVYTLQDTAGNDIVGAIQNSPGVFSDLAAGNYQIHVESGDCETIEPFTIIDSNDPLVVNFTVTDILCNGNDDGVLEIFASGGTGQIKYAISPQMNQFFDEPIFENLAPGDYQFIAQDELGCYEVFDFSIAEPVPVQLTIVPNSMYPEICAGDMDGEFQIDISGGTLPYSVSLDNYDGPYTTGGPTQTIFDFTGLSGGDHIVYVRDAQNCETEWNISMPEAVTINPVVEVDYTCVNNAQTNSVTVFVDASVDPADLDYSLNGGPYQTSNVFEDLLPGTDYYVDVRHTNTCIQRTALFNIDQFDPVTLVLADGGLNQILANADGGTGIYTYTLNGIDQGSNNTFIIYESGDYTVTVTDSNGCFATATAYFEYIDVCIPNYFTPNNDGVLDEWGPGCTEQYQNLTFDIFDRYGRVIARLSAGEKWDGKYNGNELPTGDYWYVVRLNDSVDNREFVGHFTLYR